LETLDEARRGGSPDLKIGQSVAVKQSPIFKFSFQINVL
jgi:hypothetical protein